MPNYTLLSIPAAYITAVVPHVYAVELIKRANNGRWANANAQGSAFKSHLQRTIPAPTLAKFERAESAHRNGLENLPLFAAAVLAAAHAGVEPAAVAWTAWAFCGLRVVYNGIYIHVSDNKVSFARSAVWAVGVLLCFSLFVRAALV
ncbi:hypothetical protein B0J12DRAFT_666811 [Macrophomina phaseolina]|uniref:Membrane-associated eicosanoid/glutathione metabolism (MAPEG) protein n=1 Tax=Macrophomina phaseolina TaxID=35725 RepID=A0ABQ8G7P3_9PEZI|nr:hypothetical protein B0J12DRAFT_666811 [Macrophomina phaseolina]